MRKSILPLVLSASVLCQVGQAVPFLVVQLKSGLKAETEVGQIRKVTFSPSAVTVHGKDGKTAATPVNDIQKILFTYAASTRGPRVPYAHPGLTWDGQGAALLRLARGDRVEAGLFDLAGNRVRDLGRLDLPAGEHRLSWPSVAAPAPGLYLLRVTAGAGASRQLLVPWMP